MSNNKLYVNSMIMRDNSGDDTSFNVDLGGFTPGFKQMVLQSVICDNLFTNFNKRSKYG